MSSVSLLMFAVQVTLAGGSVPATAFTRTYSLQSVLAVSSFGEFRDGSMRSSFRNLV